jgi:energy-coupling factor transporter ATP-binding protein EcfA2
MKKVILKNISLVNFKGIRDYSVDFNESITSIMGRNGSGKTTIFDAFTWLLFGKDSEDRKVFNIRTLDADGKVIERIPHEVTAIISVDGNDITLSRRFNEKWTKKRGSATEEYVGNEEERLYNNVPCNLKEWNEKIAAICPEQVFKFITNPLYFTSQKPDVQRAMLFRMAGGISDADVAAGNEDFKNLLAQLTGKTMEEYKREVAAKKRRVKQELDGIPERIDERRRNAPEREDWVALEHTLNGARAALEVIDAEMMDESKQMQAFNMRKRTAMDELSKARRASGDRRSQIEQRILADYYDAQGRRTDIQQELRSLQDENSRITRAIATDETIIANRASKVAELRAEWKRVNAETISFNDGDFICPTCKRPLDIDDIEVKQSEMTQAFNARKSSRLAELSKQGKEYNEEVAAAQKRVESAQKRIGEITESIERLQIALSEIPTGGKPDTAPALAANEEYQKMLADEKRLEAIIDETYDPQNRAELEAKRKNGMSVIEELTARLSKRDVIESNEKRIAELEAMMKSLSVELAALEGIEYTMQEFSKARIEAIEQRINGLFQNVRFKMFERQINGGEVETCEAMVGGVPFSDLNNAGKINAGLDIINAICESESINAPIFVDNAEAVNTLLETKSQMVRLVVTEDTTLVVR